MAPLSKCGLRPIPLALAGTLRRAIEGADPALRVRSSILQSTRIEDTLVSERLLAWLGGFFAITAIVLVVVGLHGLISYFVVRRMKEIGIRMALGAERWAVVRLVVGDVAVLICIGIVLGAASGIALARYVTSLLFEVKANGILEPCCAARLPPGGMCGGRVASGRPRRARGSCHRLAIRVIKSVTCVAPRMGSARATLDVSLRPACAASGNSIISIENKEIDGLMSTVAQESLTREGFEALHDQTVRTEIETFRERAAAFLAGQISENDFRPFRLKHGIYGQRQAGVQMVRCKIPTGMLTVPQTEQMARIADEFAGGKCHLTTRQNIQYHFVPLARVADLMHLLADVGLTNREACYNTVRNVTTCPWAGLAPSEVFDVRPYAQKIAYAFLRKDLTGNLPRKFKIRLRRLRRQGLHASAINDVGLARGDSRRQARLPHDRRRRPGTAARRSASCSTSSCPRRC